MPLNIFNFYWEISVPLYRLITCNLSVLSDCEMEFMLSNKNVSGQSIEANLTKY